MNQGEEDLNVLLIGESARSFSHIANRLEKSGCRCRFARSYEEARQFLSEETFELVLSVVQPRDNAIASIVDQLAGSRASFYYAQPVEEGCWWLPRLRQGERCFGTPALRPSEFAVVLEQIVAEIRASRSPEPTALPTVNVREKPLTAVAAGSTHKAHA